MPKYQIILSSDQQIPDDEFEITIKRWFARRSWQPNKDDFPDYVKFEVIEVRNLEGIKEELWKTKDKLIEDVNMCHDSTDSDGVIESNFDEISKLFKLDS